MSRAAGIDWIEDGTRSARSGMTRHRGAAVMRKRLARYWMGRHVRRALLRSLLSAGQNGAVGYIQIEHGANGMPELSDRDDERI